MFCKLWKNVQENTKHLKQIIIIIILGVRAYFTWYKENVSEQQNKKVSVYLIV